MSDPSFSTENRLRLLLAHVLDVLEVTDPKKTRACQVCVNARIEADQLIPHKPSRATERTP